MSPLTTFFLRLVKENNRRNRLVARRPRTLAGRGLNAGSGRNATARGRGATGRGQNAAGSFARGGYRATRHAGGQRATEDAAQGAPVGLGATAPPTNGLNPWLLAGHAVPMVHADPPPPPPPPAHWLPPHTPTPAAEDAGPSRCPPGYLPVPMRPDVTAEEALGFVSAPTGASGVVRLGAGMEGVVANAPPPQEMNAGPSSRAERRFGRLFGRAVAALDRQAGRRAGSWAPASLGLGFGATRLDPVAVASSSDEEAPPVGRR